MGIGDRIQQAMRVSGVTQTDLAQKLGISQATISAWIKLGKVPSSATMFNLARELRVTIHYLLTGNYAYTTVYENIYRLCTAQAISISKLAQDLGMTSDELIGLHTGGAMPEATLLKIADYFGVPVDSLLSSAAASPPPPAIDSAAVPAVSGSPAAPVAVDSAVLLAVIRSQQDTIRSQQDTIQSLTAAVPASRPLCG